MRHQRVGQDRSQAQVAREAGISRSTLSLLERGQGGNLLTLLQVLRVLGLLHIMAAFEVDDRPSPLALAAYDRKQRQRASPRVEEPRPKSDW